MHNIVGLTIFAVGIVLLIFGLSDPSSIEFSLYHVLSGSSGNRTLWMLLGGTTSVIVGLLLALHSRQA